MLHSHSKEFTDNDIIKEVFNQTNKTISLKQIYNIRQRIKKESYEWYTTLRQDQYSYIAEYKERIQELLSLQQMHHKIIENNKHNPPIQQTSLIELHKLSVTLSNFYDVASDIINHASIPKISTTEESTKLHQGTVSHSNTGLDILKGKPFWIFDKAEHLKQAMATNQQCCFNHLVKCPQKSGREFPLFDYEHLLYDTLMLQDGSFKDKHLYGT